MNQQKAYVARKLMLFLTQAKHLYTDPESQHAITQIEKFMKYLIVEAQK